MILGTVDSVTMDGVTLTIDGESAPTTKKYNSAVSVNPGDRVFIEEFGDTYEIIGRVKKIQDFDIGASGTSAFFIDLEPHRFYIFAEITWNNIQGQKGYVSRISAVLVGSGRETDTPTMTALTSGTNPFSTYYNNTLRYSGSASFAHVAVIEL